MSAGWLNAEPVMALTLYRALRDHQLALPDDPDLIDELANVHLVETSPCSYRIDHDPDKHDDRAISLALAAHHLVANKRQRRTIDGEAMARSMGSGWAGRWRIWRGRRRSLGCEPTPLCVDV